MDGDSICRLILMICLTAMSFYFSAAKTAFSFFNRNKIKSLAASGSKKADFLAEAAPEYIQRISDTLLIANIIVDVSLASIGTVFVSNLFQYSGEWLPILIVILIILIFGELIPECAARVRADSFAVNSFWFVRVLCVILIPFYWIYAGLKGLFSRIFKSGEEEATMEEELITIVDEAEEEGDIGSEESELIRSAIEFNDVTAGEILTPRVDVCSVSVDASMGDIAHVFLDSGFSRLPVYSEDPDKIIGILHEKDFFFATQNHLEDVYEKIKKPLFITEYMQISELLRLLKDAQCHMAIVADEFGAMVGIVTLEDIIEELIGDIWDEHDEKIEFFKEDGAGDIIIDCSANLDEFFEHFEIESDEDDEEDMPQTVNGWLLMQFGNFPEVGEHFTYKNLEVEVTKIDKRKIEEARVRKLPDPELEEK